MSPHTLRQWRADHSMPQSVLAKILRVSIRTLIRWENGTSVIPPFLDLTLKGIKGADIDRAAKSLKARTKSAA